MKILKSYQQETVDRLVRETNILLNSNTKIEQEIILKAPTGSGKTFIMAEYIKQTNNITFLWLGIGKGKLPEQSCKALIAANVNACILENTSVLINKHINVLVTNWEKLFLKDKDEKYTNILMKNSETPNLSKILTKIKEASKLILIIDESHLNTSSTRSKEIIGDVIKPDLTINLSATPRLKDYTNPIIINIAAERVIAEGMIKKQVIINHNLDLLNNTTISSEELVLKAAIKKRVELQNMYNRLNININPLVLIQVPNKEEGKDKQKFIEDYLNTNNVNRENGLLAIWLDKDKIKEEKIVKERELLVSNTNAVQFLVFKQALATGWDCPRAHILVRFREIKSITFEIQVIGRILRMPEGKHYKYEELNTGYIYTNIKEIAVKKDEYYSNLIKSLILTRKSVYNLQLKSYYRSRLDFGDITASFYNTLEQEFCSFFNLSENETIKENETKIEKLITLEIDYSKNKIIDNKKIDTKDIINTVVDVNRFTYTIDVTQSFNDAVMNLNNLIRDNIQDYAYTRSTPIVRNAFYYILSKYLGLSITDGGTIIMLQNIILNNTEIFGNILNRAVSNYKSIKDLEIKDKISKIETINNTWEVEYKKPISKELYEKYNFNKFIYEPCYISKDSNLELDFMKYIDQHDLVKWWWKNGSEHMETNFGIKYNIKHTFQPDFIIMFTNDLVGIFDTKGIGLREEDTKLKAEALQNYIKDNSKPRLLGGIIVKQYNTFMFNNKTNYNSITAYPSDWSNFNYYLKTNIIY